jgi:hypothetical protein
VFLPASRGGIEEGGRVDFGGRRVWRRIWRRVGVERGELRVDIRLEWILPAAAGQFAKFRCIQSYLRAPALMRTATVSVSESYEGSCVAEAVEHMDMLGAGELGEVGRAIVSRILICVFASLRKKENKKREERRE